MTEQKNNEPQGQKDNQAQPDRPQTNSTNSAGNSIAKLLDFCLSLPGASQISEMVTKNLLPIGISSLVGIGIGIGIAGKSILPGGNNPGSLPSPSPNTPSLDLSKSPSDQSVPSYIEQKILMHQVCDNKEVYELDKKITSDPTFKTGKPKLVNNGGERAWSVFRLRCQYTVNNKLKDADLDLDKFCQGYYTNKKYKAHYHHYDDPESYYCVDNNVP